MKAQNKKTNFVFFRSGLSNKFFLLREDRIEKHEDKIFEMLGVVELDYEYPILQTVLVQGDAEPGEYDGQIIKGTYYKWAFLPIVRDSAQWVVKKLLGGKVNGKWQIVDWDEDCSVYEEGWAEKEQDLFWS